jgi:phosphoserine phosphatase
MADAPKSPDHPNRIVLHIAGADRPGVTARLTEVIAKENAQLVTIGQSALHGYLMLSAIVDIPPESNALRKLLFAVSDLGLRLEVGAFKSLEPARSVQPPVALCATVLGPLSDGSAVARITRFIADHQMNIREIRALSDDFTGLELIADLPPDRKVGDSDLASLRGELLGIAVELGVDLAVQRDDIFRRNKRLVCMDVDSTFVRGEFIDELADLVGCKEQVAEITARAMRGELDFKQALAERVKLLANLPLERAMQLCERFELTPGAQTFVHILKSLGYRVGLVSGGFDFFVDKLKHQFGLDFAFANELEIEGGVLTGRVKGTIVDSQRKAQLLRDMAKAYGIRLEQAVAVGDGANDMLMLQTAGLGIAFHAKPKLQAVADMSLNHNERMDTLLYLMGFNARDLRALQ